MQVCSARQAAGIALPEHAVGVALNGGGRLCQFQPLFGPGAVQLAALDGDEAAAEFFCRHGRGAGAGEGVEHDTAGVGAREDELGQQLFGLLRRVRGVFRHGPVGYGNIVPEVRRARVAKAAVRRFLPVLRLAVGAVGRTHAAAHFHGVHVERVVVRAGGEPDILHAVFPVALCAAALFPLPGDAVLQPEVILERQADDRA